MIAPYNVHNKYVNPVATFELYRSNSSDNVEGSTATMDVDYEAYGKLCLVFSCVRFSPLLIVIIDIDQMAGINHVNECAQTATVMRVMLSEIVVDEMNLLHLSKDDYPSPCLMYRS